MLPTTERRKRPLNYILVDVLAVCTTFLFSFSSLEVLDTCNFVLVIVLKWFLKEQSPMLNMHFGIENGI